MCDAPNVFTNNTQNQQSTENNIITPGVVQAEYDCVIMFTAVNPKIIVTTVLSLCALLKMKML